VIQSDINWSRTFSAVMHLYNMAERDPTYFYSGDGKMVTIQERVGGQERLQNDCNTREQKKRYSARCSGHPGKAFVFRSGSEVAVHCLSGNEHADASQCAIALWKWPRVWLMKEYQYLKTVKVAMWSWVQIWAWRQICWGLSWVSSEITNKCN